MLDARAFAYADILGRAWVIEAGESELLVGASSRDICLTDTCARAADGVVSQMDRTKLAAYDTVAACRAFSQADFETLLGRPAPPTVKPRKGEVTRVTTLATWTTRSSRSSSTA